MYRVVVDGGIEQYERHMPTSHWRKTKIPSINYIRDTPFATDRQLEDQRLLIERNRNPRSFEPTKVDKVRSETIIAPIGASRDVAVKANILNKIVREASGVYDYAIIPPPRLRPITKKHEILEPELNPKVRPYAKESKMKPTVCSFGHRPSSASRTFHPATMKFRLKHGEIAPTGDNPTKTGFGLPVSVLKQVLYAPKIHSVPPMSPNNSTIADSADLISDNRDLFFSADEEQSMFGTTLPTKATDSWVSSIADDSLSTKEDSRYTTNASIPSKGIASDDRPAWVESHHLIHVPNSVLFRAKKSVLAEAALLPLSDRLKRYTKLSVSQTQQSFACTEKQLTDQRVLRGEVLKPPKSTPIKGKPLFVDPTFARIVELEYLRKLRERDREVKRKADKYQEMLWTIPQADYYPTSALAEIRSRSCSTKLQIDRTEGGGHDMNPYFDNSTLKSNDYTLDSLEEVSALTNQNSSVNRTTRSITTYDSSILDENEAEWKHLEAGYKHAMRAARAGDSEALYRFNMMNVHQNAPTDISDDA